jgi:uncharacterized protein (TIGR03067 family)
VAHEPLDSSTSSDSGDGPPASALDRWQGAWQLVLRERDGALSDIGTVFLIVWGDSVTTLLDGKSVESGTLKLDQEVSPARYDITITGDSPEAGRVYEGIYRFQENTLDTCVVLTKDGPRPSRFCSESGSGNQVIVWRRVGTIAAQAPPVT